MRFTQDKIHSLADQVVAMLEDDPDADLRAPVNEIILKVAGAIAADLKEEDEIDEEADGVLAEHERQITIEGLDSQLLRNKIRHEIAKKRGFKL